MQGMEKALERVSEGQRKMVQEQANDLTRQESSRLEDRKGSEKNERRMKARAWNSLSRDAERTEELGIAPGGCDFGSKPLPLCEHGMILETINVTYTTVPTDGMIHETPVISPQWFHAWELILLMPVMVISGLAIFGGRSLLKKTLPFGTAVSI
eukprot:s1319_g11.t1